MTESDRITELQARMTELVTENRALRAENEALRQAVTDAADSAAALSHSVSVHVVPDVRRADVMAFFRVAGQEIGSSPHVPSEDVVRLRLRLIAEELFELLEAFRLDYPVLCVAQQYVIDAIDSYEQGAKVDLPAVADACIDLLYVIEGALVAFGINGGPLWNAVHVANMAKRGGPKDANGKHLKPEGWQPPDIEGELVKQGWVKP